MTIMGLNQERIATSIIMSLILDAYRTLYVYDYIISAIILHNS